MSPVLWKLELVLVDVPHNVHKHILRVVGSLGLFSVQEGLSRIQEAAPTEPELFATPKTSR